MIRHSAVKTIANAGMIASLSGTAWLTAAHAAQPQVAAPAVTWGVEAGAGECTLTGSIPGPAPATLTLQTVTGTDSYRLVLAGKTVPAPRVQQLFPVTLVFGPDSRFERKARSTRLGGELGNAIIVSGLGPDVVAAFAASSSIAIDGKSVTGPFALSHARAAAKALASCVRDQLVEFGADPAQFEPGGKTPVALIPRDDWLSNADTRRMLPGDGAIDAAFRVSVAPDGSVDDCAAVTGRVSPNAEKIAWDAVRTRRLFTPASDSAGKPVRGVAMFEIHMRAETRVTSETLESIR